MTREEALQAIKAKMDYYESDKRLRGAIETLVPELRESEDDRIRRTLVEYFGPKVQLDFVRGVPIQKIRDWLEKQKEQPTDAKSERVIKAARSVLNNWLDGTDCPDVSGDFAELEYAIREYDGEEKQKEQKTHWEPSEEQHEDPEKSLEEAADEWYEKCPAPKSTWWDDGEEMKLTDSKETFIAGAKWRKRQMLKDAVEGVVCIQPGSVAYVDERDNNALNQYIIDNFKAGDKVRIIIVKEEGK